MSRRPGLDRLGRAGVGWLLAVGLLAGCGQTPTPAQAVPALLTSLGEVDSAVVHGRYAEARARLQTLISATRSAQDEGQLTAARAGAIIVAATEVLDALPASSAPSASSPSSAPTSSDEPATAGTPRGDPGTEPTEGNPPGNGKGQDNGKGHGNGRGRGHGKGQGQPP